MLLPKAMLMGSNDDEFWFWIRHKEVSSYWFGGWEKVDGSGLIISPDIIFDAMGIADVNGGEYEIVDGYYVVDQGSKRKYYNCCDGSLEKIEVVGGAGEIVSVCRFDEYFRPIEGKDFVMAGEIEVKTFNKQGGENIITLKLKEKSFKEKEFNDKFRGRYFSRPEPKGAKNVYEVGG